MDRTIPEGFQPLSIFSGFIADNGPICVKREGDGVVFGVRVGANHCNPIGICHGGWLSTMADLLLPLTARLTIEDLNDRFMLTVNLSQDFLGQAPLGCWLEGRAQLLRRTRRMIFMQGLLTTGDTPVLRTSGVFKIGDPIGALQI